MAILHESSPAIIFNAPGWYLSSVWVCEEMKNISDRNLTLTVRFNPNLHLNLNPSLNPNPDPNPNPNRNEEVEKALKRICDMDPATTYPVFNIYLQAS